MSGFRNLILPVRAVVVTLGGIALFGAGAVKPAQASAPHYADIMPLSQVKPGMKGYGLTTFKGTTISKFEVTIIGILRKENVGHDLILIRMKGGPITERGANLIQGMSGSPIYLNNKVIGAFSMGEAFPKEPVGMVTPIEDMLEAWDPSIPQRPSYFQPAEKIAPATPGNTVPSPSLHTKNPAGASLDWGLGSRIATLPRPIQVGNRRISRLVLNARADDPRQSSGDLAVLRRATSLLCVTGISTKGREWLQKELDSRGLAMTVAAAPIIGGGRTPSFKGAKLQPGSAFGTFLATGDVQVGGTGTVTYRRGNRMLGFGHPLFGLGAMDAAITSASIVDIFSGLQVSHHIAIAGPVVGTLEQDRNFSVSGELGRMPHLIPFDVVVRDTTNNRSQSFHTGLFQHPQLSALLLRTIARECVTRVHGEPGDVMAHVTTTVDAGEVGRITRSNVLFDADDIASTAAQDLSEITGIVSGNPFYPLPIRSARMTVDISAGHDTATVERIFLKQGRYEPGDSLDVGVVLKPYRRDSITRSISIKIPSDTPSGRYQLSVRGGAPMMQRFGSFVISSGAPDTQTPPVNVRQMVARLNEHEANTDIVAKLMLNTIAPALDGEKLSELPPNLSALMRSERNSGVRLERDELKSIQPSNYVVSGVQQLIVTVVRKNSQEPAASGGFSGSPAISMPGSSLTLPSIGSGLTGTSAGDEADMVNEPGETRKWMDLIRLAAPMSPPTRNKKPGAPADTKPAPATLTPPTTKTPAPGTGTTPAPTPVIPDAANDKPVGRQVQTWKQTARADFAAGKFDGTSVTANGELRIAPILRRLASTSETYIWSLVADSQGNLYAGTGTDGKILRIDPSGNVKTFAKLPVVAIQSLLLASDGTLWAGSGVQGNLFHVRQDGTFTLVRSFPEKYLIAIVQDSMGNLYVAPGGGGNVYKLTPEEQKVMEAPGIHPAATKPTPFLKTAAAHILALALDRQDNLYVGTGPDGITYKVKPDGASSVLYDSKESTITGIAVDDKGIVYIAAGPRPVLYRVTPDGVATNIFDRATSFFTALKFGPDGRLHASTVNEVYEITPGPDASQTIVQPTENPRDVDFLSLALTPNGIAVGTGNIGEIFIASSVDPNATAQGQSFISLVHDAKLESKWGTVRLDATGRDFTFYTRSGNVSEPDGAWSEWSPARMETSGAPQGTITSPHARFIQYKIQMKTSRDSAAPTLIREVSLSYLPRNQAPHVAFLAPLGGEAWAKTQTVRWNGTDPDNDSLTYSLFYSSDGGVQWKSVLPAKASGKPTAPAAPAITPSAPEEPVKASVTLTAAKDNALDTVSVSVHPAASQLPTPESKGGTVAGSMIGGTQKETTKSWDTTAVPDGSYLLKVVVSDQTSNPADALTGQAISEPFTIVNALPKISFRTPKVMPGGIVSGEGAVSQSLVAVTAVQYRVDGGDWVAASPRDGLFDSLHVSFLFMTGSLPTGKHTVEVEAFNTAGSKATEKSSVDVP